MAGESPGQSRSISERTELLQQELLRIQIEKESDRAGAARERRLSVLSQLLVPVVAIVAGAAVSVVTMLHDGYLAERRHCLDSLSRTESDDELERLKGQTLRTALGPIGEYAYMRHRCGALWGESPDALDRFDGVLTELVQRAQPTSAVCASEALERDVEADESSIASATRETGEALPDEVQSTLRAAVPDPADPEPIEEERDVQGLATALDPASRELLREVATSLTPRIETLTQRSEALALARAPSVSVLDTIVREATWLKEGYYREFGVRGRRVRVLLESLDPGAERGVMKLYEAERGPAAAFARLDVQVGGGPARVRDAGVEFVLSASSVGRAGRNPFTQALYFTFQAIDARPAS